MKTRLRASGFLCGLLLLSGLMAGIGECLGYDDAMMSPVGVLERSVLTKDVELENSSRVYERLADLFDQPGLVKAAMPAITAANVNVAWVENPEADALKQKFTLPGNASILDGFRRIAEMRKEVVGERQNYLVIKPSHGGELSYQEKGQGSASLVRMVDAVMPTRIILLQPDGEVMESFLNTKLGESEALSSGDGGRDYVFQMDAAAKQAASRINIIGTWTYRDLLDAFSELTGMRWGIDGDTLWIGNKRKGQP